MSTVLSAQRRETKTNSGLNQLRSSGKVPGILYGMEQENEIIYIDEAELTQTLRAFGRNSILDLAVESNPSQKVIISEIQKHPVKDEVVHLDFRRVDMTEEMIASVTIELIGDAKGIKEGGVLQQQAWEVEVRCLPDNLPDSFTVDISEMEIGDTLSVGDLNISEGVEIQDDLDTALVSVIAPRVEEEPITEEAVEAVETEEEAEEDAEE